MDKYYTCEKIILLHCEKEIKTEEIEVFTNYEINILKKALEGHRLKSLILMALGTGLRQGELLALKWSDIDMDNCEVVVDKSIKRVKLINEDGSSSHEIITQDPKTKYSNRTVPIPSNLI